MTIVHTRKMLLKDVYPDKFRLDMERRVHAFGIDYILEDRVETFPEPGKVVDLRTRNGNIIPGVDLVVSASMVNVVLRSPYEDSGIRFETKHRISPEPRRRSSHRARLREGPSYSGIGGPVWDLRGRRYC